MKSRTTHSTSERSASASAPAMTRREFLKRMGLLGGGLVVYASFGGVRALARTPRTGYAGVNVPVDFNAFVKIGIDNRVTCFVGKIEMGQGPITSFAQMAAEELDVACEAVDMVMGDTDRCPWDAGTWGSLSTRYYGVFVKEAACEAKGVLKQLAAERLDCPVEHLRTENGFVFDRRRPGSRVAYGALTRGRVIERHLEELPALKPASEYTISGKPYLRRDSREKVTGGAQYTGDIRLPGMLYARILRPPAHGARAVQVNTAAAEQINGVRVVRDGDLVAVLHKYPDAAQQALAKIQAEYATPQTGINDRNISPPTTAGQAGNLDAGRQRAAAVIEETYLNSYVAHAPMETHTALAHFADGKMTVWASTQAPFGVQRQVASATGLPAESVRVIAPYVGGAFGGKSASDQAIEAARLAKITAKPVMVVWSREEEFFFDKFRPAAVVKIASGLDKVGGIAFWDYRVYFAGRRGSENFYEIPHHRESVYGEWRGVPGVHPFAVGPWRAPAANTNVYARDLHLNLMAAAAGQDPLEFRLRHLKDARMRSALKAVARQFGYTAAKPPSGRGIGISCGIDAETYVASMAEVEVDKSRGIIHVKRVACAQEMGQVVNPQGATIQMEGCITMGLGYALAEEMRFEDGRLLDTNFDTYLLPRFSWVPQIETVIVPNPDLPPKGGGEPAIVCMGGVLATALHDATGARLLQLPMTPERVKAVLQTQ